MNHEIHENRGRETTLLSVVDFTCGVIRLLFVRPSSCMSFRDVFRGSNLAFVLLPMLVVLPVRAETQTFTKLVNTVIPDNSGIGVATTLSVTSTITSITDVNVTLTLSNGWNGDLYAYLVHDSGFAVLLNRAGRTAANPVGYGDHGLSVTFDDQATNGDVHAYRLALFGNPNTPLGGPLTNAWAPDGRVTDPTLVLDTDARTALLSSFNGLNANGNWTLFIMDAEPGNESTLVSWGLEVLGTNAPLAGMVSGLVELEGYAGPIGNGTGTRVVTFAATDGSSFTNRWNLSLHFAGGVAGYTLTNVPTMTTRLSAKTAWHLRRKLGVAFLNNAAVANFTGAYLLLGGDLNDSNQVDLADYYRLAASWYLPDAACDIDGSGLADFDDYFILSNNWLLEGAPE